MRGTHWPNKNKNMQKTKSVLQQKKIYIPTYKKTPAAYLFFDPPPRPRGKDSPGRYPPILVPASGGGIMGWLGSPGCKGKKKNWRRRVVRGYRGSPEIRPQGFLEEEP